ncbi:MAG TPA: RimK family alpha-L-glutamate ligase [Candidatus Sumerlaeota bacterium]|nr:RimK family alpha-L-glutamate ligase [Candidatus Sumerlaeota bacterium]HPK02875.1 RimK family alpha-L-glutamate ligase [Candidatus Sumerlaeota bacterium]
MKIAVLSRRLRSYSTRRLKEAAEARGHRCIVLNTLRFSIGLEKESPELYYKNKPLSSYDAAIPRIGASVTTFGTAVVRQFEQMGIYTANESLAISRSRDKLRTMQILSKHDIGIPPTAFVREKRDVLPAIERIGGAPVIIKVLEGTQGVGVILAETVKVAEAIVETLQSARQNVLLQKFIKESRGRDIRAIVVGDKVVAAMRRMAQEGEFRSNVHRGGTTMALLLDRPYEQAAIRAAQILGLRIAGVDLLESDEGPQVMEVNSSPGLEAIESTTKIDVAGAIVADIEHQVLFPDVDLKQRLRFAGGFGIAEFTVHNMPDLEGKRLRDCGLDRKSIHVIHITRSSSIIPNPRGDDTIERGDTLLCYGALNELRQMMPPQRKSRRRRRAANGTTDAEG